MKIGAYYLVVSGVANLWAMRLFEAVRRLRECFTGEPRTIPGFLGIYLQRAAQDKAEVNVGMEVAS